MKLGYTIIYVENVPATVAFYEQAFGLKCRFMHDSQSYAEMETGATALAFVDESAARDYGFAISTNRSDKNAAGWEICLICDDVGACYAHAVAQGCAPVVPPEQKPWGQEISYVRDVNGCLVEIASPVIPPEA